MMHRYVATIFTLWEEGREVLKLKIRDLQVQRKEGKVERRRGRNTHRGTKGGRRERGREKVNVSLCMEREYKQK